MKRIIYIDESGTGGQNSKEEYLILIALVIDDFDYDRLKRVIKKTRMSSKFRNKIVNLSELKFSNTNPEIRDYIFDKLIQYNIEVHVIYIDNKNSIRNAGQIFDTAVNRFHLPQLFAHFDNLMFWVLVPNFGIFLFTPFIHLVNIFFNVLFC